MVILRRGNPLGTKRNGSESQVMVDKEKTGHNTSVEPSEEEPWRESGAHEEEKSWRRKKPWR